MFCNHGGVTDTLLAPAADPQTEETQQGSRHVNLAILALAIGGFAIGTTEFVTMGLLPADRRRGRDLHPGGRARRLGVRAGGRRRGAADRRPGRARPGAGRCCCG